MSHVRLVMKSYGDVLVITNRGRPTTEQKQIMNCPKKMKKELKKLRKQMGFKDGTDILLALSVASDEMMRHVHMFPEVFFMDVTANTNRQKRELFILVVKDASGETFIGNATVIPSGKKWVFLKIYQTFFLKLYGPVTIGRNRLAITDDDRSEYGPLENCVSTLECYAKSKHMLCIFHAIAMGFYEKIRPKLPHKKSKKKKSRELTIDGDLFGNSFVFLSLYFTSPCVLTKRIVDLHHPTRSAYFHLAD